MAIVLISGAIIGLYILGYFYWKKHIPWKFNPTSAKLLKYFHFIALTLFVTALVLNSYHLSFRGIRTTGIIVIALLISGAVISFFSDWQDRSRLEKFYFRIYALFPVLTILFLCIPFLGAVIFFSLAGRIISPVDKIFYEDQTLRIQSSFAGVLAGHSLDVFEKHGLFEYQLYKRNNASVHDIESVRVAQSPDSASIIVYYTYYKILPDTSDAFNNSLPPTSDTLKLAKRFSGH